MINFDCQNPFPLVSLEGLSYDALKSHSSAVDHWLGFQTINVEKIIHVKVDDYSGNNIWTHIDHQGFQTPYLEIRFIFDLIKEKRQRRLIDIGCAYGRVGIVNHFLSNHFEFTGVELVNERVEEARRVYQTIGIDTKQLIQEDILHTQFDLSSFDIFFCYDFSKQTQIDLLLEKLKLVAAQKSILVIGRGGGVRNSIHRFHPWLCEVNPAIHFPRFSIYQS